MRILTQLQRVLTAHFILWRFFRWLQILIWPHVLQRFSVFLGERGAKGAIASSHSIFWRSSWLGWWGESNQGRWWEYHSSGKSSLSCINRQLSIIQSMEQASDKMKSKKITSREINWKLKISRVWGWITRTWFGYMTSMVSSDKCVCIVIFLVHKETWARISVADKLLVKWL